MRIIKFRAWDKKNKRMVDWNKIDTYQLGIAIADPNYMTICQRAKCRRATLF